MKEFQILQTFPMHTGILGNYEVNRLGVKKISTVGQGQYSNRVNNVFCFFKRLHAEIYRDSLASNKENAEVTPRVSLRIFPTNDAMSRRESGISRVCHDSTTRGRRNHLRKR